MEKKEGYSIENIYQGGYSSLNPIVGDLPSQYPITGGSLGITTDPRSANILKEASTKLSAGLKQIELAQVSPQVFESIPDQHLKEVRRLSQLTGVGLSLHGPVVDTTGITQQGFSELNREASERRILQTIQRGHKLDKDGNILITFHSAEGIPGSEILSKEPGKEKGRMIVVNRESGKMAPIEPEKKFYPSFSEKQLQEGRKRSYEKELGDLNFTEWDNSVSTAIFSNENADRIMENNFSLIKEIYPKIQMGKINPNVLSPPEINALKKVEDASEYLKQTEQTANALFNKAAKYGNEKQKKELFKISNEYQKILGIKSEEEMSKSSREEQTKMILKSNNPELKSQALHHLLHRLQEMPPEMYIPVEKFAIEQSSKTFGNAAFDSWKEFKDKAPIVSIENPPAGFALSTGEDLKNLIKASREQFVKKAKEEGISKSEAERQAEKLIGATWDVGHINMLRQKGFKEKDIVKESEKIAPFVKHVHLSDNFGFEHTELPMGMGNVPLGKIMKKLGKKGFEAKKIIEAGNWWQHFQTSPVQETMEAVGSSIYSTGGRPYWNQVQENYQGYYGGFGQMLPQGHYNTLGAGFSQLPAELGGQQAGEQGSRMSGKPME